MIKTRLINRQQTNCTNNEVNVCNIANFPWPNQINYLSSFAIAPPIKVLITFDNYLINFSWVEIEASSLTFLSKQIQSRKIWYISLLLKSWLVNSHCTCIVLLTENADFWNDWRHPLLSNQLQQLCIWYDLILFVCSNRLLTSHSAPNTAAQLAHFETTTGQWVLTLELLCRRGVGDIRHTLDDNKETFPPSISLLRRCLDFFQFGMKFGMRAMQWYAP